MYLYISPVYILILLLLVRVIQSTMTSAFVKLTGPIFKKLSLLYLFVDIHFLSNFITILHCIVS